MNTNPGIQERIRRLRFMAEDVPDEDVQWLLDAFTALRDAAESVWNIHEYGDDPDCTRSAWDRLEGVLHELETQGCSSPHCGHPIIKRGER